MNHHHVHSNLYKFQFMSVARTKELKTLVVDDDRIVGMLHRMVLSRFDFGASPRITDKGDDALQQILNEQQQGTSWIVFLDLHMPGMTGWEFLDAIRNHNLRNQIYVVIVSSSVDPADRARSLHYPFVLEFVSKPLSTKHLEALRAHPELRPYFDS